MSNSVSNPFATGRSGSPRDPSWPALMANPKGGPGVLPEALRIAAKSCGSGVKVISGAERLSYSRIDLYSNHLAAHLLECGVGPSDRVIIGLPNSTEFIIACFAIWKAGAVVVALDHCIRPANLEHVLEDVAPTALIAGDSFAEKVQGMPSVLRLFRAFFLTGDHSQSQSAPVHVESLQSAMEEPVEMTGAAADIKPDDLATITFTSGSTKLPKGVMHTHESILSCASFTLSYLGLSPDDIMMLPLPLHHVLAFRRFVSCVLAHCTLVLAPDIFVMKQFSETQPTGLVLAPSGSNILIDNFRSFFRKEGGCLRYVEVGSEPISPGRLHALQQMFPDARIQLTYGLTEGRVGYLHPGADGIFDRLDSSNRGLEIDVIDRDGHPVGPGESGEILIAGSGLFSGYWGDSIEAQARRRKEGFRTGDMGAVDENGRIRFMGRMDDMIKIAGHRINPREIEMVLQRHAGVVEAVVVAHFDPADKTGPSLCAFAIRRNGTVVSETELVAHCREHLELYKVPARIHFRESFPKTPLGKIQRHLVMRQLLA